MNGTTISEFAESVEDYDGEFTPYHKGESRKSHTQWQYEKRVSARADALVIAWDGEGLNLNGIGRPQTYVLFGCSADPDSPLMITRPDMKLTHQVICEYICDIGSRFPGAIHVGYSFAYDQNMIIQCMPLSWKIRLKDGKWIRWNYEGFTYRLKITWRKRTHLIRENAQGQRVSVRIDDIFPSFHSSFVSAYERYFPRKGPEWETVKEGKSLRGERTWYDIIDVRNYWRAEIVCLAELGTLYRDLLYSGGFTISDFYGPGPIASFIRRRSNLIQHEWGAKECNLPSGVHHAAKSAFYGGRFEQFLIGRIEGPVYSIDINSAYPFALCHIPSLDQSGFWHRSGESISPNPNTFGVYKIHYKDRQYVNNRNAPRRSREPQPLPFRDRNGIISYPAITEGWYWAPEVRAVLDLYPDRIQILDGWEWVSGNNSYPWREVMERLFAERKVLKQAGAPLEMVYKLAINSMYGKYAQRVGWNKEKKTPPGSHALPIAGFVTSMCRAMILRVLAQLSTNELIAVETDGIYTTANPADLVLPTGMGNDLGQWEAEEWQEALYVQNGVYYLKRNEEWIKAKTRGFLSTLVSPESIIEFLHTLEPREIWPKYQISMRVQSFIGIGSAIQWARNGRGFIVPSKANVLHCQWIEQSRELIPGGKGKRTHVPAECGSCKNGNTAYERPHSLISNHGAFRPILDILRGTEGAEWEYHSYPHRLPWESEIDYSWRDQQDDLNERIEILPTAEFGDVLA